MTRGRAARGPGDRGVEIGNVDQVVTADLFLGVGIRTVEHLRLAVGDANGGRVGRGLQSVRAEECAGLAQGFAVGHVRGHALLLLLRRHIAPAGLVHVKDKEVLHRGSPSVRRRAPCFACPNDARRSADWTRYARVWAFWGISRATRDEDRGASCGQPDLAYSP